jgi:hypothetical protein
MTQVTENKGRWYSLLVTGAGGRHRREVLRLRFARAHNARRTRRETPLRMTANPKAKAPA